MIPARALLPPLLLPLALGACREQLVYDTPIPVDDTFTYREPSAEDQERFEAAADYSREKNGLALLVIQDFDLLFDDYADGYDPSTPIHIFSGTKSFTCAMAQTAIQEGALTLDEPAVDTLDEWRGDTDKEAILVEHLLHFTSGLRQDSWHLTHDGLLVNQRVDDKYARAVDMRARHPAGEVFDYGSTHLMVFGELFTRKLNQDPVDYLQAHIFDPIGFRYAGWHRDPSGNPMLPYGCWTTANEWAKYGALVRDDGDWQGTEVLPPGMLASCLQGSSANPGYGLTFWLNQDVDDDVDLSAFRSLEDDGPIIWAQGPADLVAAAGYNDNRLYILPSRDLLIVRLAERNRHFRDSELLELLLGD